MRLCISYCEQLNEIILCNNVNPLTAKDVYIRALIGPVCSYYNAFYRQNHENKCVHVLERGQNLLNKHRILYSGEKKFSLGCLNIYLRVNIL